MMIFIRNIFILLCFALNVSAETYYVATDGNDSNDGLGITSANAWLTWEKAFRAATAGDTVYFRGGVYPQPNDGGTGIIYDPDGGSGNNGTKANPIVYMAYPDETPILDNSNVTTTTTHIQHAIKFVGVNDITLSGLTIRNLLQIDATDIAIGLYFREGCNNITIDQCIIHGINGNGTDWEEGDTLYVTNSDSYDNVDILQSPVPGNNGGGFADHTREVRTGYIKYTGCRAWDNGDQGFVSGSTCLVIWDSCWSFNNGKLLGGGHGWKMGYTPDSVTIEPQRRVTNCIAAYNRASGFTTNDNNHVSQAYEFYNNIAYHNVNDGDYDYDTYGIVLYNTSSSDALELKRVFKNNISYDNEDYDIYIGTGAVYTHSNNTWDGGGTVTAADFGSLDSTGISGARQADGSLPDLGNFLKLAEGSDLVDAGIDVGLPYLGLAPDIGAFESFPPLPPSSTGYKLTGGDGKILTDGNGKILIGR